jgi:MoxR-like ATPase
MENSTAELAPGDRTLLNSWLREIQSVYRGHEKIVKMVCAAIIADGHVLIEDLPGSGKTLLAKTIAHTVNFEQGTEANLKFKRVQFTPDLLPMDIIGLNIYDPQNASFHFQPGPIFANILLVDEINRASPKVQSALLEAMGEKQVTIDRTTYQLEKVFFVIGTENPIDHAGVYPLPLAQLDRFMMRLIPGAISPSVEMEILKSRGEINPGTLNAVVSHEDILRWRGIALNASLPEKFYQAVQDILLKSRSRESKHAGLSTRAGMHLVNALKAYSLVNAEGMAGIIPDDFKMIANAVLLHRIREDLGNRDDENILHFSIMEATESLITKAQKDFKRAG